MKAVTLSLLLALSTFGQSVPMRQVPAPPAEAPEPNLPPSLRQNLPDAPHFNLSPLDVRSIPARTDRGQPAIGKHRALPASAVATGMWSRSDQGRALWRLRILDPQAMAVRVHFRNFHAGAGRVWVHNGQAHKLRILGPFTRDGVFHDGDFWTSFIFGDSLVIEYEAPDSSATGTLPFQVEGVTHLWEFLGKHSSQRPKDVDTSCELDAVCYAGNSEVGDAMKTVVMMVVPAGQNLVSECTGTMLNDKNATGTPYMLTAGHCITSDADARAMTAYWNFQSSTCNGSVPDWGSLPNVTGGTLLSQNLQGGGLDYAFVLLSARPNASWSQAGWSTGDVSQNDALVSISHPRFLPKRFAYLYQDGNSTGFDDSWEFTTAQGRVDHGSSGSALFSTGGQVRATLSSGLNTADVSACSLAVQTSNYTKFSSIFARTSTWLTDQARPKNPTPAVMEAPIPGSTLPGSTVSFSWTDAGASEYFIYVGTTSGGKDLFAQNVGSGASHTIGGLPSNGEAVYLRLWSHMPDAWYYNDYRYQAYSGAGGGGGGTTRIAQMLSPVPGSTLTGSNVTFSWTQSATASEYVLYAGASMGGNSLFSQNVGALTSYTVYGLPTDGSGIYIRLWSHLANGWYYYDYAYTASKGGGGSGGTYAQMISPAPGSTLSSSTVTFSWSAAAKASEYFLYMGTSPGSKDLLAQNVGLSTSDTISNLPANGENIYVRLWSHLPDAWYYFEYSYTAYSGGGGGSTQFAEMISPAPGSTFGDSTVTFSWTQASTASEYFLYIGTTPGGNDIFGQNVGDVTAETIQGLPTDGSTLYVRLWSHLPDAWYHSDYVYYAVTQ